MKINNFRGDLTNISAKKTYCPPGAEVNENATPFLAHTDIAHAYLSRDKEFVTGTDLNTGVLPLNNLNALTPRIPRSREPSSTQAANRCTHDILTL